MANVESMHPLGDNIDTINRNTETVIDASKEVVLEINLENTKYMLLSRHQKQIVWKCVTVQKLDDNSNKSKFDWGGN
jgi:hypothetical protein